jgi:hypothetical protein
MLDPEVHDEQYEQRGARDALQIPVECSSRHKIHFGIVSRKGAKAQSIF